MYKTVGHISFRVFASLLALAACTNQSPELKPVDEKTIDAFVPNSKSETPELVMPKLPKGVKVTGRDLPGYGEGEAVLLPSGGIIPVVVLGGVRHIPIELLVDNAAYAQLTLSTSSHDAVTQDMLMTQELTRVIKAISNEGLRLKQVSIMAREGFATGLAREDEYIAASNSALKLPMRVLLNPVVLTEQGNLQKRTINKDVEGAKIATRASLSGLERIGEPAFVKEVGKVVSEKVDGSSVKLGIADTGITLNHPTFYDAKNKSRVVYMKDSSGEGRAFFHPTAKFDVSEATEDSVPSGLKPEQVLILDAQFIAPTKSTQFTPVGDKLSSVEGMPILVSEELRSLLLSNPGAKLGAFSEESFRAADEVVDMNQNKKVDDRFWAILVPDEATQSYKIFIDFTATLDSEGGSIADFRKSVALASYNTAQQAVSLFSEKVGVDITSNVKLPTSEGGEIAAVSASLVGFDPGNHGSHVAGIAAGRKTIANDTEDTLARGVAPAAQIMMNRVCSNNGGCTASSAMIDLARSGAEIVNMSLGGLGEFNDGYGVQETLVNRLTSLYNTLFVISAGNSGPSKNTIGSPSTARHSLSVGATATRALIEAQYQWQAPQKSNDVGDDFMLFFSSRGPTAAGGFKPSLSAPGTELSAIQLNAAPGARAGLDVYWGTSMAAPTAAGAASLLLDAAKKFNAQNPQALLPVDALTLRNVLMASARPFNVTSLNLSSGEKKSGEYTWIDQGTGMLNLPAAWEALKAARDTALPKAIIGTEEDGSKTPIAVDYQIRVLRKNPNGIKYDGSLEAPVDAQTTEPRFGTGVWLDANDSDSLVPVQIVRALPFSASRRADVGDLVKQLNTTADEFALETVVHGSHVPWVKAGVLTAVDCHKAPAGNVDVIGQGAVLVPKDESDPESGATSTVLGASVLNLCVDRAQVDALPAGDHGALVHLYRVLGGKKEAIPSLTVPVYLSKPHKTMAGSASYLVESTARAFDVSRNYIQVPEGTSLVEVELEVPAAKEVGNDVRGCAGAELMIREGKNTLTPKEFDSRSKATAVSCDLTGKATPEKRIVRLARSNPNPGLWDVHVFGRYQFPESPYKLKVTYARVESEKKGIAGESSALNGAFSLKVLESSQKLVPSSEKSEFVLKGLKQVSVHKAVPEEDLPVPNLDGQLLRTYKEDVAAVVIATGGSPENDIDLVVAECNADGSGCSAIGQSGSPTDVESVTFAPKAGKAYVALVNGYDVQVGKEDFEFSETQMLREKENGTVSVSEAETGFVVEHTFDVAASKILAREEFLSSKYTAVGHLKVIGVSGAVIAELPVSIQK